MISPGSLLDNRPVQLVIQAAIHRLPTIYPFRESVDIGRLMSYGSSAADRDRLVGAYAGRILKGEKPAELPVMRAVKFEFLINLQTARAGHRSARNPARDGRRGDRMIPTVQRRGFISLLGGAAAAWPMATRAQQGERVRRIGWLSSAAESHPDMKSSVAAFRKGLLDLGWIEGRNLQIDFRWYDGNGEHLARDAAELVALLPDVIMAVSGGAAVGRILDVTRTVPIVFTEVNDPVARGFVASLSRPSRAIPRQHQERN